MPADDPLVLVVQEGDRERAIPIDPDDENGFTIEAGGVTAVLRGELCADYRAGRFDGLRFEQPCAL